MQNSYSSKIYKPNIYLTSNKDIPSLDKKYNSSAKKNRKIEKNTEPKNNLKNSTTKDNKENKEDSPVKSNDKNEKKYKF